MSKKRRYTPRVAETMPPKPKGKVSPSSLSKSRRVNSDEIYQFVRYEPPPGVIPNESKQSVMAMDSTPYDYLNSNSVFACQYVQYHFPGYAILSMWSQFPEYRKMSETIAKEMTRKWIRITAVSHTESDKKDKSARVAELQQAMEDYCVQDKFRQCAELDGFFGRGQLYIDLKSAATGANVRDVNGETEKPLILDPKKIPKNSLIGFNVVEPIWTYPGQYNSTNPLASDFYRPTKWYVMAQCVDASRLLMFMSREVPDLLKAAYNFGGMSLSQLAKPYVDNWIRTRKSVGDMVHSYSLSGIKTDMGTVLSGADGADADAFFNRAELFNNMRDNRGLMLLNAGPVDAGGEEFFQFNTPLSGLDKLQAQAQEQVSAIPGIPLVKFWGITPSGLNASTDGEIRVFYDSIHAAQEHTFSKNLKIVMEVIMLSLWGEIDQDISFEFEPLWSSNDTEKAQIRKLDAEADSTLIAAGVIAPIESRKRVAADPDSGYNSIDVSDDSDLEQADTEKNNPAMDGWITLENGQHALLDDDGNIQAGMGGNFNGQHINNIGKNNTSSSQPKIKTKTLNGTEIEIDPNNKTLNISNGDVLKYTTIDNVSGPENKRIWAVKTEKGYVGISSESASTLREAHNSINKQKLEKSVPGIHELMDAVNSHGMYENNESKKRDSEDYVVAGKAPKSDIEAIKNKYPRAAIYLKADGYSEASNYKKSAAGREAKELLESGGSQANAEAILNNWLGDIND